MILRLQAFAIVALGFLTLPGVVLAQSAIAGAVKDTTGAVLPGVTVEVSSPALIEKTKTATTNEAGQYRVVDLRPGHLQGHVHVEWVQHDRARRDRARGQLHRPDQRGHARRQPRRDRHRHRGEPGRRRADQPAP